MDIKAIQKANDMINSSFPHINGSENSGKSIPAYLGDRFINYFKYVQMFGNEAQKRENAKKEVMLKALNDMRKAHQNALDDIDKAIKLIEEQ